MTEEKYTRCPGCATVFRVTPEQLAVRAGQVRCGQCKTVFDALAQQVSLTSPVRADVHVSREVPRDEGAAGAPAATLPEGQAPESPFAAPESPFAAPESPFAAPDAAPDAAPAAPAGDASAGVAPADRFAPAASATATRTRLALYATAIALLVLLVAAQAAFHFRDAIVTFWPGARPAFARLCATAGCAIRPLRDSAMSYLSIEASDLQADPAHRGLLILTATVRNRASWPLAYPHLELTLTDAQDRIVVRRALAPGDFAGGAADLQRGIAPNAEISIKVFIDASATTQAGYRLYMFYP